MSDNSVIFSPEMRVLSLESEIAALHIILATAIEQAGKPLVIARDKIVSGADRGLKFEGDETSVTISLEEA